MIENHMKINKNSIYTYLSIQLILFIGFLYFPLFSVENFFFFTQKKNIINILIALYTNQEFFLFLVLVISTVIIPSFKFLFSILVFIRPKIKIVKRLLYFFTKWSMLDLLLIAIAVTIFKLSFFTEMKVELGSYFLCAFVLLSIFFEEIVN
ncbi:paraquat-inducible protein A [Alphaproteobacteria bacterium]|nr:paraquat-inducible protein A [Alphaproteobacteria bacterium]